MLIIRLIGFCMLIKIIVFLVLFQFRIKTFPFGRLPVWCVKICIIICDNNSWIGFFTMLFRQKTGIVVAFWLGCLVAHIRQIT